MTMKEKLQDVAVVLMAIGISVLIQASSSSWSAEDRMFSGVFNEGFTEEAESGAVVVLQNQEDSEVL